MLQQWPDLKVSCMRIFCCLSMILVRQFVTQKWRCGCRSLSSKVVSQYSTLLSPMAVDAVLKVLDPARPDL